VGLTQSLTARVSGVLFTWVKRSEHGATYPSVTSSLRLYGTTQSIICFHTYVLKQAHGYIFFFVQLRPNAGYGLLIHEVSRSHTSTHHTELYSSGRVISPLQRPLPDNTQHSQHTNIHVPGGIRTHKLSRRAAADTRFSSRGHWDRPRINLVLLAYPISWLAGIKTTTVEPPDPKRRRSVNLENFSVQCLDNVRNSTCFVGHVLYTEL